MIRHRGVDCYDQNGNRVINCLPKSQVYEEAVYFWDEPMMVKDFLGTYDDPYLMIHNTSRDIMRIDVRAKTPFALPTSRIESYSKNGDALQVFEFLEDRSRYYDALKYGVYDVFD